MARSPTGEVGPRGKPRSAKTINDTYLSALSAVYAYALDRLLVTANPTSDVKRLPADANAQLRERDFTKAEQRLILGATLSVPPPGMAAHNAAARRWVPWLCAYTGARVNEITQLRAMDVKQVEGVWTIHITPEAGSTKTNKARTVPVHEHLIEQGFLAFVEGKEGPLFYDPSARRKQGGRPQYKKAGTPDVAVIGGGAIGLVRRAGRRAPRDARWSVLDRGALGDGASRVAAGMLAPVSEADAGEPALLRAGLASAAALAGVRRRLREARGDVGYRRVRHAGRRPRRRRGRGARPRSRAARGLELP